MSQNNGVLILAETQGPGSCPDERRTRYRRAKIAADLGEELAALMAGERPGGTPKSC